MQTMNGVFPLPDQRIGNAHCVQTRQINISGLDRRPLAGTQRFMGDSYGRQIPRPPAWCDYWNERPEVSKTEGFRNPLKLNDIKFEGQDLLRNKAGYTPEGRLADLAADGTDAEDYFPQQGFNNVGDQ